jgi:hypothetical protein
LKELNEVEESDDNENDRRKDADINDDESEAKQ